jgi:hypothetical protein
MDSGLTQAVWLELLIERRSRFPVVAGHG